MLINEKALQHWIDHFYGYGAWSARIWFIAYEESGGEIPEEVAEKLDYFYSVHEASTDATLCDMRELYRHVPSTSSGASPSAGEGAGSFRTLYEYRFGDKARQNTVWKNLISFAHGFMNEDLPDVLAYQQKVFASPASHREALIRLFPLPRSNHHAWYYSWLDLPRQFHFLKSRALYQEHLYQRRIDRILHNISAYKPEAVLMYGMENINVLKRSVQAFFPTAKFKMVKAIARQIPQHHRAELGGTAMFITTQIPALRHNRIETGFDWQEFGKATRLRDC